MDCQLDQEQLSPSFKLTYRFTIIIIALLLNVICAQAQTTQEWRDSVSVLSRMIEQNPRSLELRMRKAEANIMLEQWRYALEEYTDILDINPKHIGALYFRAFVNTKLRKYSFARTDYEAVLKFEPTHLHALLGLVTVNIADNRLQEAYDQTNHLVELYPEDPLVYSFRAEVEDVRGMTDLAVDDLQKAIEIEEKRLVKGLSVNADDDIVAYIHQLYNVYRKAKNQAGLNTCIDKLVSLGMARSAAVAVCTK